MNHHKIKRQFNSASVSCIPLTCIQTTCALAQAHGYVGTDT